MGSTLNEEDIRRIIREEARAAAREEANRVTASLAKRQTNISGAYRELAPVAYGARDAANAVDDRSMGFEHYVKDALAMSVANDERLEAKVDALAASIPPAALASLGAEAAAVAGAKAAIDGKNQLVLQAGRTEAVQVAADRADKQSLAAKQRATWSPIISTGVLGVLWGIARFIEWLISNSGHQ